MIRRIAAIAAVAAAGYLQGAATANAADACSLLTKQDAAAALGEPVNGPESTPTSSMGPGNTVSSCEYTGTGFHKVHLNLIQMSPETATYYKAFCNQKGKEGLTGLGEVACWYSPKHEELQVLKALSFFSIELKRSGDPTDANMALAKKVFDRL